MEFLKKFDEDFIKLEKAFNKYKNKTTKPKNSISQHLRNIGKRIYKTPQQGNLRKINRMHSLNKGKKILLITDNQQTQSLNSNQEVQSLIENNDKINDKRLDQQAIIKPKNICDNSMINDSFSNNDNTNFIEKSQRLELKTPKYKGLIRESLYFRKSISFAENKECQKKISECDNQSCKKIKSPRIDEIDEIRPLSTNFLSQFFYNLKQKNEIQKLIENKPVENHPKFKDYTFDKFKKNITKKKKVLSDERLKKNLLKRKENHSIKNSPIEQLLKKRDDLYLKINDDKLIEELKLIDKQIYNRKDDLILQPKIDDKPITVEDTPFNENAAKIALKYFKDENIDERKIIQILKRRDFISDILNLLNLSGVEDKNESKNEMIEKIILVLNTGDIYTDTRLVTLLNKTIETLTKSKDPFTCKVAVNMAICKKYVEDFIELKKIVEEFTSLRL